MKIDFDTAKQFLEKTNSLDNAIIFTHSDLDGFASGILLQDYLTKKGAKVDVKIIDFGNTKISDKNFDNCNKVFITDLSPGMIWKDLAGLKDKEVFYTDHHLAQTDSPIPEFVYELRTTSQGYIPSTRTVYELTQQKDKFWLATLGVLSDMAERYPENNEFLQNAYKKLGLSYESLLDYLFKLNFSLIGSSSLEEAFRNISKLKKIEDIVKLEEYYLPVQQEFERLKQDYYKRKEVFGGFIYYPIEARYPSIKSALINAISNEEQDSVLVFTNDEKEKATRISARNQSKKYDVSQILKDSVAGLKDGFAGGHRAAAGGQVDISDLEKFKERLKQINLEQYKI